MKRLSKAATAMLWGTGIICVLGMAGVGMLELKQAVCGARSELVTAVETMRSEGQELKYTIKDELEEFKDTIKSFK